MFDRGPLRLANVRRSLFVLVVVGLLAISFPAGEWHPRAVFAAPETPVLPDNYYLQAEMGLVWQDGDGTIACGGVYTERAVPDQQYEEGDSTLLVDIQERWADDCPIRRSQGARVRMDSGTGQWLSGGEKITQRWGWDPAAAAAQTASAIFEVVNGNPVPVWSLDTVTSSMQVTSAYDENGLWVWSLRRETVPEANGGPAEVLEAWMVTSTTRRMVASAGLALPAQHDAWWASRLWLGPYDLPADVFTAFQTFTGGQMVWLESDQAIRVLRNLDANYRRYADEWVEGDEICPGAGRFEPPVIRGFGKIWCDNEDGFARSIGVPVELEWGKDMPVLPCAAGEVIRKDLQGDIILLPDGTWRLG